ncbi:hypothetical protein CRG98_033325 [Punica granatum]|uniref:Uncharacterized protein n=1 Tax=Punica granatum TaxID=22663 RepID=A0A2I0IQL1_PUNGR|nr:hypothetical protein CRG98_033325 [Punica granatum]
MSHSPSAVHRLDPQLISFPFLHLRDLQLDPFFSLSRTGPSLSSLCLSASVPSSVDSGFFSSLPYRPCPQLPTVSPRSISPSPPFSLSSSVAPTAHISLPQLTFPKNFRPQLRGNEPSAHRTFFPQHTLLQLDPCNPPQLLKPLHVLPLETAAAFTSSWLLQFPWSSWSCRGHRVVVVAPLFAAVVNPNDHLLPFS